MTKSSRPWTIKQLISMIKNGSLVFDNAVQRSFVWDKKKMSLLIDSILRDYPIPAFYAVTDGRKVTTPKGEVSVYDCLDGKQRCMTLLKFMNNEFELTDLDPIMTDDGEIDLNGKKYEDLPEELQDIFKSAHINAYSFDDASDDDIVEIMARLNNGKPLSAIDLTRIRAKDLKGISKLGEHKFFKEFLTEKVLEAHQQEEIIVKVYSHITDPKKGLDNKDIKPLYESLVITPEIEKKLTALFDYYYDVLKLLSEIKGSKRALRTVLKKTHLISTAFIINIAIKDKTDVNIIAWFINYFFGDGKPSIDKDYNDACISGSNHAENVIKRNVCIDIAYDLYTNKKH